MPTITPFTISIPDSKIQQLKQKLKLTMWPDELEDVGWEYGTPLADVKRVTEYWKDKHDWRKVEKKLNELPHFMTAIEVEGFDKLDVHFIHQRSEVESAIPLLVVHGWPGSFLEVTKLLPLLADSEKNGGPAFHVVAPSLPNFGFSSAVRKRGFGIQHYAETCHKLMLALGYEQYASQGGDWGALITRVMGTLYPSALKASHLNLSPANPPSITSPLAYIKHLFQSFTNWYSPRELAGLERSQWFQKNSYGYWLLQATKPQTPGYSLADSPVGLLAWVYEKLHDWSDEYEWTEEELCTWISVYWFSTAGPAASVRIYYESQRGPFPMPQKCVEWVPDVKLGLSYFPKELILLPRSWAKTLGPIVYNQEHDKGGHFPAYEVPDLLVGDLRVMFGKGGGAYGVVEGRNGY